MKADAARTEHKQKGQKDRRTSLKPSSFEEGVHLAYTERKLLSAGGDDNLKSNLSSIEDSMDSDEDQNERLDDQDFFKEEKPNKDQATTQ